MLFPGRPALPALLCASAQEKGWGFPEKQACLFSRKSPAFSVARELSWRRSSFRRILSVFQVCFIARTGPGTNRRQPPVADALPAVRSTETSNLPCGELRRLRLRTDVPGSGDRGLKKPPLLRTAGNSLAALKPPAHTVCFTKCAASPKTGPGPGGSWFRGPGLKEPPQRPFVTCSLSGKASSPVRQARTATPRYAHCGKPAFAARCGWRGTRSAPRCTSFSSVF